MNLAEIKNLAREFVSRSRQFELDRQTLMTALALELERANEDDGLFGTTVASVGAFGVQIEPTAAE